MEQEQINHAKAEFQTNANSLLEEMKLILTDFFVCSFTQLNDALLIDLENGQTFRLDLQEIT